MDIPKQILRNTAVGWFEMSVLFVFALVVPPLLLANLGKEGYGVWILVGQVIAYLGILDLGISSSVGRFVAKYNAKKDYIGLSRVISSSIFLFLVSSVFIVIATLIIGPRFSNIFHLSEEYFNIGKWLILLTGLSVAMSFPLRIGPGMLEGIHRFDLMYFFRTSGPFLRILLIIIFFGWLHSKSLLLLAVITIVATIVPSLFMCGFAYNRFSNIIRLKREYIKFSSLKEIWSLSFSALLITVAALLLRQGQVICVGRIIGPEEVVIYGIPVMLLTYGSKVIAYIIAAFKPMASHMHALNEEQKLQKLNIEGVKISFVISLFIAVMAVAFGCSFFRVWLSSRNLSAQDFTVMSNVLTIMVIGFAIGMPQAVTDKMFSGAERHWFVAGVSLLSSLTGLFVGILLMVRTDLGLYGMAVGWSIVYLIKGVLVFPISAYRHFKIKLSSYIRQAYLPPLAAAIILIVATYLIRQVFDEISLVPLLCSVVFCSVVYAIAVYFICLERKQRAEIWSIVSRFKIRTSERFKHQ